MDMSLRDHLMLLPKALIHRLLDTFLEDTFGKGSFSTDDNVWMINIRADSVRFRRHKCLPGFFHSHLLAFKSVWPPSVHDQHEPIEIRFRIFGYRIKPANNGQDVGYPMSLQWLRQTTCGLPPNALHIWIPSWFDWNLPHTLSITEWDMYFDIASLFGTTNAHLDLNGYFTHNELVLNDNDGIWLPF